MRKVLLIPTIFLGICIVIFMLIIFIFVNPDHFKPFVTTQIEKYTGCQLVIDGHLYLTFFPYIGVKANHIQIITSNEFQTSSNVDMNNVVVQLKLLPLLHGRFKTGAIQIERLTLNQERSPSIIQINNIKLKISMTDPITNIFVTNLSFHFTENSLPLSGYADFTGDITADWKNNCYSINNTVLNVFITNHNIELHLTSDMIVDILHQTASWKKINTTLYGLTINGELNAENILSNPSMAGHFVLQVSHIKKIFEQINFFKLTENIPDIDNLNADINLFLNNGSFDIQSNLHINNIEMSRINIDNINAILHFKNNILNIESIEANLLGGILNGEVSIPLSSFSSVMTAHIKAFNIQIDSLLKLIQDTNVEKPPNSTLSGTGNIELDVSTAGVDEQTILNNLNGTSHVSITNGILMGKEWDDIVTKSLKPNTVISQEMISQYLHVLRFKQLSASFKIHNGIFMGNDLLLDSADINIKGKGTINFPNNLIKYELQAEFQNVTTNKEIENNLAKSVLTMILIRPLTSI